jgi:hypothetical protein
VGVVATVFVIIVPAVAILITIIMTINVVQTIL